MGCPRGTHLPLITCFTKPPPQVPTWDSCVFSPFRSGLSMSRNRVPTGSNVGYFVGPTWGCTYGTQLILATCFTKVPIGLAYVWAKRGSHMGLMCIVSVFGGFSVGRNWVLTESFVDCLAGPTWAAHMGPSSFWPHV